MADDATTLLVVGAPRSGASLVAQALRTVVPSESVSVTWDAATLPSAAVPQGATRTHVVLVVRNPVATVSSLISAWTSRRFATDQELPGWWGDPWAFAVLPDWQDLIGKPTLSICARQWAAYIDDAAAVLESRALDSWSVVVYEDFVKDPRMVLSDVLGEAGLPVDVPERISISATGTAVTRPGQQHWVGRRPEIESELIPWAPVGRRMVALIRRKHPEFEWPALPQPTGRSRTMKESGDTPFESQFSAAVPQILQQTNLSLAISTYKSGHVVIARAAEGRIDTEFVNVPRAMGIAVAGNRLAVGATTSIKTFTSASSLASKIQSPVPIDTVYVPRSETQTGDIAIHDMAYDKDGDLYFVNTKFNCLCVQDLHNSFVPVWRPNWITALAPEDRCHLNGLAMVEREPRYVTVLARTDTAGGWREHRGTGGTILDITNDEVVAEGLSMPHSPRWHDGRLWILESGKGALGRVDLATGRVEEVVRLPGFTRGLTFIGRFAFVGLSQVRESVFAGLPVTETATERNCGVWVVDTQAGSIVGMLKFSGAVQELFEVAILPSRWPTVIGPDDLAAQNFVLPESAMREIPASLRDIP